MTIVEVGLVTDIGGLDDRSFNYLADKGAQTAKRYYGIDLRVLTSKSNADYIPNLSSLARHGYDLLIGVGFLMANAVETVSKVQQVRQQIVSGKIANVPDTVAGQLPRGGGQPGRCPLYDPGRA